MDDFTIARIVHVVAVLMWIGGVAFVTTVIMPALRRDREAADRLAAFHRIENGFAWQAKIWVLLAGASGFWMVWRTEMWSRFADLHFWWMWAMLLVWLVFMIMLFILEPLFLHKRIAASPQPQQDFRRMERVHYILLAASIIATIGAVGGSHGLW
jgi:uncharacterized membrane protein